MARESRQGLGRGWWGGWAVVVAVAVATLVVPSDGVAADTEFPVPNGLAPAVRFWVDVFTKHPRTDVIIHDRLEPGLVYDVVHDVAPDDDAAAQSLLQAVADRLTLEALRAPEMQVLFAPPVIPAAPAARLRVQRGMRETFEQGLVAERLFRPIVRKALAAEGLPVGLAALPLVESSYHPGLASPAGAVGLWQLTPAATLQYVRAETAGLDLRRDPFRSSTVAARYLRDLHDQLGSWPLAITAYNHGPSGVQRARQAVGSDDLGEIVRRYDGFGFASRSYYAEFLAARHVLRNTAEYFPSITPGRLVAYRVKRGDTLSRVAKRHGVTIPSLRVMNGIRSAALRPGQVLLIRL